MVTVILIGVFIEEYVVLLFIQPSAPFTYGDSPIGYLKHNFLKKKPLYKFLQSYIRESDKKSIDRFHYKTSRFLIYRDIY